MTICQFSYKDFSGFWKILSARQSTLLISCFLSKILMVILLMQQFNRTLRSSWESFLIEWKINLRPHLKSSSCKMFSEVATFHNFHAKSAVVPSQNYNTITTSRLKLKTNKTFISPWINFWNRRKSKITFAKVVKRRQMSNKGLLLERLLMFCLYTCKESFLVLILSTTKKSILSLSFRLNLIFDRTVSNR